MKTKLFFAATLLIASFACKKDECYDCHYDGPGGAEVEIGEYCGDAAEELEETGFAVDTNVYIVHCGEH